MPAAGSAFERLRTISLIVLPAVLLFAIIDQAPYLTETFSRGQIFGRDAHNLWIAGRILLETGVADSIYDNAAFTTYQTAVAGAGIGWNSYLYPPPALLLAALAGLLPYAIALVSYTLLGLIAFVLAITIGNTSRHKGWLLALFAPMTIVNIIMGQNGLISAALLIGGLRLLSRRPGWAGLLFGLLAFKPFLGIFLPILLCIRGDWRALSVAAVTVVAASILPVMLWGWNVWELFLADAVPVQKMVLHSATGIGMLMIPSAFNSGRILGLGTDASYFPHAIFAAGSMFAFLWYFLQQRARIRYITSARVANPVSTQDILVIFLCTALISPYIHNYDLSMLEGAVLLYSLYAGDRKIGRSIVTVLAICWTTGFLSLFLNALGVPIAPLMLAVALYLMMRSTNGVAQLHS